MQCDGIEIWLENLDYLLYDCIAKSEIWSWFNSKHYGTIYKNEEFNVNFI